MKKLLIIASIVISLCSCFEKLADHTYTIEINNKSNRIILVYADYILPDTLLSLEKPNFIELQSGKSEELYDDDVNDPQFNRFETEKLTLFVLSKDSIENYTWEEIRNDYNILKRYEINEQDLINMGGSVTYP